MENYLVRNNSFILSVLFLFLSFESFCQKLPKTQEISLRSVVNLRVDGKQLEWNSFQAYNTNTDLFYTIANNDDHLYLIVQARNPDVINKIILGAVTLTINRSVEKNDKNAVSITFPVYDRKDGPAYINLKNKPSVANTESGKKQTDSFMNAINKQMISKSKLIGIAGVETIKDSILSIYNEDGIKAEARFDSQLYYTYELSVPLKYLGLSINNQEPFAYHIKLNGTVVNGANAQLSPSGRFIMVSGGKGSGYMIPATSQNKILSYPTDFWGRYLLKR